MLSLIKKEIRDGYLPLAISVVLFMLVMSYFKGHDMASLIVFMFWAPVYMLLSSQGVFVRERNQGTSKFLFSLPMSKNRLYLGKMIGSLITGALIYLTFIILMAILGLGGASNYYEVIGIKITPVFVYAIIPLGAWVCGAVAGLLHPVISGILLVLVSFILGSPLIYQSPGIYMMNPIWLLFILLSFGLTLSYLLFQNSYEQNSWSWVFQSVKYLVVGCASVAILVLLLSYLGKVGSKKWNPVFGVESKYFPESNKFLVRVGRQSNMLDLIPGATNDLRVFSDSCIKKDDITGHYSINKHDIHQIPFGNRYTYTTKLFISDDGNDLLYRSNSGWLFPDVRGLYLLNTISGESKLVNKEAYPLAYTKNGNILFYTYNNDKTGKIETYRKGWTRDSHISVQLYDKRSHSSKEICVVEASTHFSRTGRKIIADTGTIPVIDLDTLKITSLRKQLQLTKGTYVSTVSGNPYFATITLRKKISKRKSQDIALLQYTSTGEIIKTKIKPDGSDNMEFRYIGGSKDGNICFVLERDYLDKSNTPAKLFIATKAEEPLLIAEHLYIRREAAFSNSGKYFCFQFKDQQNDHMITTIINVETKAIVYTTKDKYIHCSEIKPFKEHYFIAKSGADIHYFGHDTNNDVISLLNIQDEFGR